MEWYEVLGATLLGGFALVLVALWWWCRPFPKQKPSPYGQLDKPRF